MHSFTEENYLKTIYKLSARAEDFVTTNAIAEALNTKAASVTDMLKKLADKKLINYKRYQGVSLSPQGRTVAVDIVRKHRLWEVFLVEKLNFGWDEVHEVAEELEHIGSEKLVDRLDKFLGFPKYDPHGDPIPSKSGKITGDKFEVLFDMQKGQSGIISGVRDHSAIFLQYLDKLTLTLGKTIKIMDKNEYDGSMMVLLDEKVNLQLSKEVTKNIFISV